MKKGFISMSLVFSFLIIFLLMMGTILGIYTSKASLTNKIVGETKSYLNGGSNG